MRLATNFVPPMATILARSALISLAIAAASLGVAVWHVIEGAEARANAEILAAQIESVERRIAALPPLAPMQDAQRVSVVERASEYRRLLGGRGEPLPAFMAHLEQRMPEAVYLVGLHYDYRKGEVKVLAEAADVDRLNEFFRRLEADRRYSEVGLARRSERAVEERVVIQDELRLRR